MPNPATGWSRVVKFHLSGNVVTSDTHVHFTFDNGLEEKCFINEHTDLEEGTIIEGTFSSLLGTKANFKIVKRNELIWGNGELHITYSLTPIN